MQGAAPSRLLRLFLADHLCPAPNLHAPDVSLSRRWPLRPVPAMSKRNELCPPTVSTPSALPAHLAHAPPRRRFLTMPAPRAFSQLRCPLLAASSPTIPWAACSPLHGRPAPLPCLLPVVQLIQTLACLTHTLLLLHDRPRLCAPCCSAALHHPVAATPLGGRRRRSCYPVPMALPWHKPPTITHGRSFFVR